MAVFFICGERSDCGFNLLRSSVRLRRCCILAIEKKSEFIHLALNSINKENTIRSTALASKTLSRPAGDDPIVLEDWGTGEFMEIQPTKGLLQREPDDDFWKWDGGRRQWYDVENDAYRDKRPT